MSGVGTVAERFLGILLLPTEEFLFCFFAHETDATTERKEHGMVRTDGRHTASAKSDRERPRKTVRTRTLWDMPRSFAYHRRTPLFRSSRCQTRIQKQQAEKIRGTPIQSANMTHSLQNPASRKPAKSSDNQTIPPLNRPMHLESDSPEKPQVHLHQNATEETAYAELTKAADHA